MISKLKVYSNDDHPHQAQGPEPMELPKMKGDKLKG
jgi:ribosomal protein L13